MDAEHAVLPVNLELVEAVVYHEDDITLIGSGQFELGHPLEKLAVEKDVASTAIEFAWTSTVGVGRPAVCGPGRIRAGGARKGSLSGDEYPTPGETTSGEEARSKLLAPIITFRVRIFNGPAGCCGSGSSCCGCGVRGDGVCGFPSREGLQFTSAARAAQHGNTSTAHTALRGMTPGPHALLGTGGACVKDGARARRARRARRTQRQTQTHQQ